MRAFEFAREIIHAPVRRTNNFVLWYKIICAPRTNNSVLWYKIVGVPTKFWPPPVQGKIDQRIFVKQEEFQSEMPLVRDMIEPISIYVLKWKRWYPWKSSHSNAHSVTRDF